LVAYFANKYNIIGKKANTLNPDIDINWDLLRGVYDGDGSFKKGVVLTSKSKAWIDKIIEFYQKYDIHYTVTYDTAYRLSVYKKKDLKRIYHYLYDNTTMYLQRKKDDLSRLAGE
jgi:intein/homing endonuclease